MPMTTVEVHDAQQRMQELIDAVLAGQDVVFTYFGEPVGAVGLERFVQGKPPAWVRDAVTEIIENALKQLRGHLDPPPWRRD